MWLLVSSSNAEEKHTILGDKKYVVGRTGCDITINDPSVSRKQALIMMAHYEANVVKSFITPSLTLEDASKFGTHVNGESVKKKPGCIVTLKDGDKIQFGGSPASIFIATYKPFVVTTSCLEKAPKKNLQHVMCLLGGHVVREWRGSCDLLIMAKINVTIKVICAINNQKHIVTPDYLDHFHQYLIGEREHTPDPQDYLPEVVDKEVPMGVSFHPDVRRATLLNELKFYFLSAHQFNKTNLAVSTAGGLPILLEDGTEEDADLMTQDGTIVVAVSRDILSSLSPTCQKFVRTVYLALKKKNLRMVTDPEIGWAILTCKTDDFCNPKSAITPSMYSSMASQSLSQMTEVDDLPSTATSATRMLYAKQQLQDTEVSQRLGAEARSIKRPASAMVVENGELSNTAQLGSSVSPHEPVSKRVKAEILVSESQDNLFDTDNKFSHPEKTRAEINPTFKCPSSVSTKRCAAADESKMVGEENTEGSENRSGISCDKLVLNSKEQTKNVLRQCQPNKSQVSYGNDNISRTSLNERLDVSEDLISDSLEPKETAGSRTRSKDLTSSSTDSPSSSKFLNKKSNKNNSYLDDALSTEKQSTNIASSTSSTSLTSTKKRKKRALFSENSDEDDDDDDENDHHSVSHLLKKKKLDNQGEDKILRDACVPIVSLVDVKEPVKSAEECNGDTQSQYRQAGSTHGTNGDICCTDDSASGVWTTVKKEVNTENVEQKHNTELILDSNGQPLRHLCEVKVVSLVAQAAKSPATKATTSQAHLNGLKNFKSFKKTAHRGSSDLPTIIGGSDLQPHKGAKLIHMEDLMEAAAADQNGVEDEDELFGWDVDNVHKRKTRRT